MNMRQRARLVGEECAQRLRAITAALIEGIKPSVEALADLPEMGDSEGQVETIVGFMLGIGDVIPDNLKLAIVQQMTSKWAVENPELVEEVHRRLKEETQQ